MRGGAWEQRSFRLFFFGQGISAVGDRIVSVALAFAVLDLTGSVKDLGLVLAAQTVPLVLFLLMGGVWSDRLSRRAVMLTRSEEHTSELQSLRHLVCRLLLAK